MIEVPEPDEATQTWWDATREQRLLVQECGCGHVQHPPRTLCTGCGRTDRLGHRQAGGLGVVDACTVVHRSPGPAPGPGQEPPYVVARIRLAEGVVLLSNVEADDPATVAVGDEVRVAWRPLPDGRALPVFRPAIAPTTEEKS